MTRGNVLCIWMDAEAVCSGVQCVGSWCVRSAVCRKLVCQSEHHYIT